MNDYRNKLNKKLAQYNLARATVKQERKALSECRKQLKATVEAQQTVQSIAANIQASAHRQIASVVTRCLQAVFDEPYQFKIDFQQKRGKTEAVLVFERDGLVIDDPMSASGGGPISVAAFALRLACLLLKNPQPRRLLCLDEPFSMLDSLSQEKLSELLVTLAKEMGFQMIFVTHSDFLQVGKVIRIT